MARTYMLADAEKELNRLREAIEKAIEELQCRCERSYSDRLLHEPGCKSYIADDLKQALAGQPKKKPAEAEKEEG